MIWQGWMTMFLYKNNICPEVNLCLVISWRLNVSLHGKVLFNIVLAWHGMASQILGGANFGLSEE
jgi:hypothetical protein